MCPGGGQGQLLCPLSWAWAEQSWVGSFEDLAPLFSRTLSAAGLGEYWPCAHSILVASPLLALLGAGFDHRGLFALTLSWGSAGHHRGSCGSEEDRLRRRCRWGLVLDQPGGGGPGAGTLLTGKLWELLAYYSARALPPHPEAHPPKCRCPLGARLRALCGQCVPGTESAVSGKDEQPARVRRACSVTHRDACRISSALLLVWFVGAGPFTFCLWMRKQGLPC